MIDRIRLTAVYVKDQVKARDFYVKELGFVERKNDDDEHDPLWIEVAPPGTEEIALALLKPGQLGQGYSGIAFVADDFHETYETLKRRKVRFKGKPAKVKEWWEVPFADQDDNKFLLVDPLYHKRPHDQPQGT